MLRPLTKDEIIDGLRKALQKYADTSNWRLDGKFTLLDDICMDDCSGLFRLNGEIARQALNRNHESTKVNADAS